MPVQGIITTDNKTQVIDVTEICQSMLGTVQDGVAVYNILQTSAALIICEDETELRADLVKVAENWLQGLRPFRHSRFSNPNAEAHITSAFAGTSLTIPVVDGMLHLGKWQSILLLELDGPRRRKLFCTTIAR